MSEFTIERVVCVCVCLCGCVRVCEVKGACVRLTTCRRVDDNCVVALVLVVVLLV